MCKMFYVFFSFLVSRLADIVQSIFHVTFHCFVFNGSQCTMFNNLLSFLISRVQRFLFSVHCSMSNSQYSLILINVQYFYTFVLYSIVNIQHTLQSTMIFSCFIFSVKYVIFLSLFNAYCSMFHVLLYIYFMLNGRCQWPTIHILRSVSSSPCCVLCSMFNIQFFMFLFWPILMSNLL